MRERWGSSSDTGGWGSLQTLGPFLPNPRKTLLTPLPPSPFFFTHTHTHTQDWENSYYACGGIVYLIDLSDKDRFAESKLVLDGLLATEHLQQTPIVILGNKCDIMGCAREDEVRAYFNMQVRTRGCGAALPFTFWPFFFPPLHSSQIYTHTPLFLSFFFLAPCCCSPLGRRRCPLPRTLASAPWSSSCAPSRMGSGLETP